MPRKQIAIATAPEVDPVMETPVDTFVGGPADSAPLYARLQGRRRRASAPGWIAPATVGAMVVAAAAVMALNSQGPAGVTHTTASTPVASTAPATVAPLAPTAGTAIVNAPQPAAVDQPGLNAAATPVAPRFRTLRRADAAPIHAPPAEALTATTDAATTVNPPAPPPIVTLPPPPASDAGVAPAAPPATAASDSTAPVQQ